MCDFGVSEGIMAALSVASAATSYAVSQQQANAQAHYQNQMSEMAGQSAHENFNQQTGVAGYRMQQNAMAAGQQDYQNELAAAGAIGHAQAAAAEAGVGGNAVSELFDSFHQIAAMNRDTTQTNLAFQNEQIVQSERAMRSQAQSQINNRIPGPVQYPSLAGSLLTAGTGVYSAWNDYSKQTQTNFYDPSRYTKPSNPGGWNFFGIPLGGGRVSSG
jgi:hypothetical protein